MSIRDIIKDCGGAPAIATKSRELNASDPLTYRVAGLKSVYNWPKQGIPEKHWPLVMRLSSHDEKSIHRANREIIQRGASGDKQKRPNRHALEAA